MIVVRIPNKIAFILGVLFILTSCSRNYLNETNLFNLKTKNQAQNIYYAWSTEELNKDTFPARILDANIRQYNWYSSSDFNLKASKGSPCLQTMIFLHRFYADSPNMIEPFIYADKVYGYFEVYSHNRLIYSFPADKQFNSHNATMHLFHVQPRWAVYDSHVVKFRFYPDESGRMGFHGNILFGSQRAILNRLIRNVLPQLALSLLLFILSIIFLIITLIGRKKKEITPLTIPASLSFLLAALALTINRKVFFTFFDFSFPYLHIITLLLLAFLIASLALFIMGLIKFFKAEKKEDNSFITTFNITEREREILDLVSQGQSSKQIGDILFISPRTVDNHLYNIYQKTNTKNRVQLVKMLQESKFK